MTRKLIGGGRTRRDLFRSSSETLARTGGVLNIAVTGESIGERQRREVATNARKRGRIVVPGC